MSQDRATLAESWQFIYSALKRRKARSYPEINAGLRSIIDRMGYPGRSARDLVKQIKADEMRKHGRKLTLDERLEQLKKRMRDS